MTPTRAEIDELRLKYAEMLRLRLLDQAGTGGDPRQAMAELAKRFPGALREIDELPLEVIRARIAALTAAEEDPSRAEPWMAALAMFHTLTRGALAVKRWLGGRRVVDEETARAFALDVPSLVYADDALAWCKDLALLASPPRGKVTDLVFEKMAGALGVSNEDARMLVFGPSRAARAASREKTGE